MRLSLAVSELVIASWTTDADAAARAVYPGLAPAEVDGEHLVSVVALRCGGGRLGRLPVLPFSQVNVRTYVDYAGEPAVFFLRSYVTLPGLGGALLGAPLRAARIRFRPGRVAVPAAGLDLAYRVGEAGAPGEIGLHERGLYEAAGLRSFTVRRGPAEWRRADPVGDVRADAVLALGFDVGSMPQLSYARGASFELDVPARAVEAPRSSPSRAER